MRSLTNLHGTWRWYILLIELSIYTRLTRLPICNGVERGTLDRWYKDLCVVMTLIRLISNRLSEIHKFTFLSVCRERNLVFNLCYFESLLPYSFLLYPVFDPRTTVNRYTLTFLLQ